MDTIKTAIEEFSQETNRAQKQMQETARRSFLKLVQPLFETHKSMLSFGWGQFEPWRDGEETQFEVMTDSESISINKIKEEEWEYSGNKKDYPYTVEALDVSDFLKKIDNDVMEKIFGHGAIVQLNRDGTMEVEEYSE